MNKHKFRELQVRKSQLVCFFLEQQSSNYTPLFSLKLGFWKSQGNSLQWINATKSLGEKDIYMFWSSQSQSLLACHFHSRAFTDPENWNSDYIKNPPHPPQMPFVIKHNKMALSSKTRLRQPTRLELYPWWSFYTYFDILYFLKILSALPVH